MNQFKICGCFLITLLFGATAIGKGSIKPIVIGKLGQVRYAVDIRMSMNSSSAVYWQAKQDQYLVLSRTSSKKWFGVLLQNGGEGYVLASSVDALPFLVTKTAPTNMTGTFALSSRSKASVADYALNFIGTPYVWGGDSLQHGADCSGFVQSLFGQIGIDLPRTAAEQALVGTPVTRLEDLQPGDRLYFWEKKRNEIGHTGIYIGNGYFVHSSMGHHGVATDYLNASWRKILVCARR